MFMRAITRNTRMTSAEAAGSGGRPPNGQSLVRRRRASSRCLASIGDDRTVTGVVMPQDLSAEGPPLPPARALALLGQLAEQLEGAHQGGVLDPNLDLGAERLQYVSPEQILGQTKGPPSDVYSLSAVLYRYLTGAVPFPHGRGRAVLFWHLHAPRPRPTAVRPSLPAAIDGVLVRGMATDPAARPPTAGALIEESRRALRVGPAVEAEGSRAEPAAVAAQPRWSARRAGGRRIGLLATSSVVALSVAAGVVGFLVAGAADDPSRSSLANAGRLQLRAPADWRRPAEPRVPSSLRLAAPVVLAPHESSEARLVAGVATPAATVAMLSRLGASPPSGELVALGGVQARRYRVLEPRGGAGPMTLYVAPTNRRVATIACVADGASVAASFMRRCEGVAASISLAEGRFTPVGPSASQSYGQARALRRLNAARSSYRSQVGQSRTPAGVAEAARELAFVHTREALVLRSLDFAGIARPGGLAVVRALRRAAAAYRSLAATAENGDRRGYAAARRSALAADAALRRGLQMLRLVGYGP
jgi:hypothetical protein